MSIDLQSNLSGDLPSVLAASSVKAVLQALSGDAPQVANLTQLLLSRATSSAQMNIFIHVASRQAMQQAQQRDTAGALRKTHALHGLPLVVKDNVDVAGMPTTSGSPVLQGHVSKSSASAIERLTQAGAVILGKVNLHELCFGITSNNATYGPVRNPHAPTHMCGGSSGGTAAAIAAGLAPAGIGSDTGGSLRIPAAMCGVVGFRPTTGRWPSDGVVKISDTRDTLGPMGRTVADCALLDAVVCNESTALEDVKLAGLRIGIPQGFFWQGLDPEVAKAASTVREKLTRAGAVLVDCDIGFDREACDHAGMVIAMHESLICLGRYMKSHGLTFDAAQVASRVASPDVRGIFEALISPQAPSVADYAKAMQEQRPALRQAYANCFERYKVDALLFPTTPLPATPIGQDDTVMLLGQAVPTFPTYTRNVASGSIAGLPGISIPMGCTAAGLPMGIALDGPVGSDRRLLSIAQALQNILDPSPVAPFARTLAAQA
jgi:indoleacetamide hydrolase